MWLKVTTYMLQWKMDVPLLWKTLPSLDKVFTGRSVRKKSTQVKDNPCSITSTSSHAGSLRECSRDVVPCGEATVILLVPPITI